MKVPSILAFAVLPNLAVASTEVEPFNWDGFYAGITAGSGKLSNKGNYSKETGIPGTTTIIPDVTNVTTIITPDVTNTTISFTLTSTNVIPGSTSTIINVTDGSTLSIPGTMISDFIDFNPDDESWFLGAEIGYDKKVDAFLFGGILDFSGTKYATHYSNELKNVFISTDLNWFSTARVRAGIPLNRLLIYGTAGLALGNFDVEYMSSAQWSASYTEIGWAAGAGAAYALSQNWVVDLSYLHLDFNSVSQNMGDAKIKSDLMADLVKLGINYKF